MVDVAEYTSDCNNNLHGPLTMNEEINANKMMCALSAIALEMQKFHADTPLLYYHNFDKSPEACDKLSLCKSNLRLNRKQIKLLRRNLRKACIVARIVISAKENERTSLHNHINSARSDCIDLYHKNIINVENIHDLTSKNRELLDKINKMEEIIELGYRQLQKMQNIHTEELPTVMKLKEIMLSCGQYYADFNNEYDARLLLEQKNRFLNSKVNILVNNLEALNEEVKNLRHQNKRLQKDNAVLKNKYFTRTQIEDIPLEISSDTNSFVQDNAVHGNHLKTDIVSDSLNFDLTSHLSLVKDLLNNQDVMLNDLKKLSEKLSIKPKRNMTLE